ncbi:MAG: hypothetical protein IT310_09230 [Anaerolineales bacterium]|nr:hypothetical protein [Anaerolineales bacterium]
MLALLLSAGGEAPGAEFQLWLGVGLALFALLVVVGWWTGARKPNQAEGQDEAHGAADSKTVRKKSSH